MGENFRVGKIVGTGGGVIAHAVLVEAGNEVVSGDVLAMMALM
jgi:hypothetical protein